jgi:hypothetical protein
VEECHGRRYVAAEGGAVLQTHFTGRPFFDEHSHPLRRLSTHTGAAQAAAEMKNVIREVNSTGNYSSKQIQGQRLEGQSQQQKKASPTVVRNRDACFKNVACGTSWKYPSDTGTDISRALVVAASALL